MATLLLLSCVFRWKLMFPYSTYIECGFTSAYVSHYYRIFPSPPYPKAMGLFKDKYQERIFIKTFVSFLLPLWGIPPMFHIIKSLSTDTATAATTVSAAKTNLDLQIIALPLPLIFVDLYWKFLPIWKEM